LGAARGPRPTPEGNRRSAGGEPKPWHPPDPSPGAVLFARVPARTLPGPVPGLGLASGRAALSPERGTAAPEERGTIRAAASPLATQPQLGGRLSEASQASAFPLPFCLNFRLFFNFLEETTTALTPWKGQ